ncbi:helix-turn-helix domain-containing protein [Brevibacillus agri]|uniref:helix-turn-helix domain-containing protein n=1 Tax=Brevibacillus agri TaxID=51101 RepID=UPI002867F0C3|nr:helix-turn-helix transcriptional regulator [Brevibacillus agri]
MEVNKLGTIHIGFGEAIRTIRLRNGMSLHDLAEKTGISSSYIVRIESGKTKKPSFSVIECLVQGLGIDLADLLNLIESNTDNN